MQKLFNKILVPVDFSAASRNLVERAVEIAGQYHCSIQLLHVVTEHSFAGFASVTDAPYDDAIQNRDELEAAMHQLSEALPQVKQEKLPLQYSIIRGSWDEVIMDVVDQHQFDLVLISQKSRLGGKKKMDINPDKISEKTNIPVITVPPNRKLTKLCSIVIPVTDFLPLRKLMYGVYLASGTNTTIRLLGIENEHTHRNVEYYLKKAYCLIYDNCNIPVELEMIKSNNIADAVNEFSNKTSTDLVIVNPGVQSKMPGFFSSLWGNIIQRHSSRPVLTVSI